MNILAKGTAWLAGKLEEHAGTSVAYVRGPLQVTLSATLGDSVFEEDDLEGATGVLEFKEFILNHASLILGGVKTLPARGDIIQISENGVLIDYEVNAPAGGQPYQFEDGHRNIIVVQTMRKSAATK